MRFTLTTVLCLSLWLPGAQAGDDCDCDSGRSEELPPEPDPPSYSVRWLDETPASRFGSMVPLGNGRLVGVGTDVLWRWGGQGWRRQRPHYGGLDTRALGLGDGRLVVMHEPSPEGSADSRHQGRLEVFASSGRDYVHPPSRCTLSSTTATGSQLLAGGQCAIEERSGRVRVEGVVVALNGSHLVEQGPRPRTPVRAVARSAAQVVMLDVRGRLYRLEGRRWRLGLPGVEPRGWRSLAQSAETLLLGSETGEIVRVDADGASALPRLARGAPVLELVATGDAVLARTADRLWLWDGDQWQDRGPTPDDCGAVDYCEGYVTQLSRAEGELWALRDGVPERHYPGPASVPFFAHRRIDEVAVGTRGELFWTRHDAGSSVLMRTGSAGTRFVHNIEPRMLWAGTDALPWLVDRAGTLYRYDAATGRFAQVAEAPCASARLLLGYGDHAYYSCQEPGVLRMWNRDHYTRVVCPANICGATIVSAGVSDPGFPHSMGPPGSSTLVVSLADGTHAARTQGQWVGPDDPFRALRRADVETPAIRQVDAAGRVWALRDGQLIFDGPDTWTTGLRGLRLSSPLPSLSRLAISHDARVIWVADRDGRLFQLTQDL